MSSQQIRSLFSNFTTQLKDGTLKAPQPTVRNQQGDGVNGNEKGEIETTYEEEEEQQQDDESAEHDFQIDISQEANRIFSGMSEWEEGDYVAVRYEVQWFPGKIKVVHGDGSADVTCMQYADNFNCGNKFRWARRSEGHEDTLNYEKDDLLLKLGEPQPVGSNKRLQYFEFSEEDFSDASDILDCK